MTQGERIKLIRELRKMTQKDLGIACGFSDTTADVRIRQYESNKKSPKKDTLNEIAGALQVHVYSIMQYETDNATDTIETLFWLETAGIISLFEMKKENNPDNEWVYKGSYNDSNYFNYNPPIGITVKYNLVNEFMQEWYIRYTEMKQGKITNEQYMNWKLNWPNSCDDTTEGHVDWQNIDTLAKNCSMEAKTND